MTGKTPRSAEEKISAGFAARLARLESGDKVYAIVLLRTRESKGAASGRRTRGDREATMTANRRSAERALGDIDDILARFDGQRLKDQPDVLGSIPVEITKSGIKALALSKWVRAILEDQEIHLIT